MVTSKNRTRADFVHELYQMLGVILIPITHNMHNRNVFLELVSTAAFSRSDNAYTVCISRFDNEADDE